MNATNRWLAFALALALIPASAMGQAPTDVDDAAVRRQLDAARAELKAARERVAELSRELGEEHSNIQIRRFVDKRPMLGFVLGVNDAKGVRLDAVTPDGPAARAGLRSGDVITGIDGQALVGASAAERIGEAQRRLGGLREDQEVALAYERDGKPEQIRVTAEALSPFAFLGGLGSTGVDALASLKDIDIDIDMAKIQADVARGLGDVERRIQVIGPMIEETVRFDAWRWQGLRLAPLDADLGRYFGTAQGALVLKADGESLGGLEGGDVIQSIDGEPVADPGEAMRLLAEADPGQRVAVGVLREKRRTELAFTAPERPDLQRLFRMPAPPAPPAPPSPPSPPSPSDAPAPTAPPPPVRGGGVVI